MASQTWPGETTPSSALVGFEQRTLRWAVLREALWLKAPESPRTGKPRVRLWLVVFPLVAAFAAETLLPFPAHPVTRDLDHFLDSAAGSRMLPGQVMGLVRGHPGAAGLQHRPR